MRNITDDERFLLERIKYNRKTGKHVENLSLINEYLSKGYCVFEWILITYIISLIKSGNKEKAKENIDTFIKLYPGVLSNFDAISFYIMSEDYNKVFEMINDNNILFTDVDYLRIGIKLLSDCQYILANDCFIKAQSMTDNIVIKQKCDECLKQINNHFEQNAFVCQNYKQFKNSGKTVLPGYIISGYVNNKNNEYDDQRKYNRRPHVVLEINDNKAYCLPMLKPNVMYDLKVTQFKKWLYLMKIIHF